MNFEESNKFVEQMENNSKKKKVVIGVIGICFVVLVLLVISIIVIKSKDASVLKLYIDDKQKTIPSGLIKTEDDTDYYNIKLMCQLLGVSYQQGEYQKYNENADSCYVSNDYCITSLDKDSNRIIKYFTKKEIVVSDDDKESTKENVVNDTGTEIIVGSEDKTKDIVILNDEIKFLNNGLYVSSNDIEKIFNIKFENDNPNRLKFYTLEYLNAYYSKAIINKGYKGISNIYENLSAIADNLLVVTDGNKYGVLSLKTGSEVISLKYDEMIYMQGSDDFLVKVDNSMGVVSSMGDTIINPIEYDSIKNLGILSDDATDIQKLYLVEKNGKYGVVNSNNEIVVFVEYDSIGLKNPENFSNEEIQNFNLIFNEFIPVYYDDKVGMFNTEGQSVLKCIYEELGCVIGKSSSNISNTVNEVNKSNLTTSNENTVTNDITSGITDLPSGATSVLTIPEEAGLKGIVVKIDGKYGIFGANEGHLVVPCMCSNIYSITKSNVTQYYLVYNGISIELKEYLAQNEIEN